MKYIKLFNEHSEYEAFTQSDFIKPNVSHCVTEYHVHYNPWTWAEQYLTFVAQTKGTFTFTPQNDNVISYSTDDGETWPDISPQAEKEAETILNDANFSGLKTRKEIEDKAISLNQRAADLLSHNGKKVIKYNNRVLSEKGGPSYIITDPSVFHYSYKPQWHSYSFPLHSFWGSGVKNILNQSGNDGDIK